MNQEAQTKIIEILKNANKGRLPQCGEDLHQSDDWQEVAVEALGSICEAFGVYEAAETADSRVE